MSSFIHLIKNRYSGRNFDNSRAVEDSKIDYLIDIARWSPSCFSEEPWRYLFGNKYSNLDTWNDIYSCLAEANQLWAKDCPLFTVIFCKDHFSKNGKINYWAKYDTGASAFSMMLGAVDIGLIAHQMGGFDTEFLCKKLDIPEDFTVISVMCLGYAKQEDDDIDLNNKMLFKRVRKPINELFFKNKRSFKN